MFKLFCVVDLDSLEHRLMEMEMCTEEDIIVARSQSQSSQGRRESRLSKDVTVIEPAQTKRDLFEEDQDNDIREREADKKDLNQSKNSHKSENDRDSDSDNVVFVEKDFSKPSTVGKVSNGSVRKVDSSKKGSAEVRMTVVRDDDEENDKYPTNVVSTDKSQDMRRCVVSEENASYVISDERVVEFSGNAKEVNREDAKENTEDDVNIYEDMPQDLDLFQPEEEL